MRTVSTVGTSARKKIGGKNFGFMCVVGAPAGQHMAARGTLLDNFQAAGTMLAATSLLPQFEGLSVRASCLRPQAATLQRSTGAIRGGRHGTDSRGAAAWSTVRWRARSWASVQGSPPSSALRPPTPPAVSVRPFVVEAKQLTKREANERRHKRIRNKVGSPHHRALESAACAAVAHARTALLGLGLRVLHGR